MYFAVKHYIIIIIIIIILNNNNNNHHHHHDNNNNNNNNNTLTFSLSPQNSLSYYIYSGRRCGLVVGVLDSGSSGSGWGPGRRHCVVLLGKTLYSHCASLHPGV